MSIRQPVLGKGERSFRVYCGIDFGTHGTAYAFCTPDDPNPHAQQNWGTEVTGYKTRTDILLNPQRRCVGVTGFGNAAYTTYISMPETEQRRHFFLRRFKMALYQTGPRQPDEKQQEQDIEETLHTADERRQQVSSDVVLREALRHIVSVVMGQIRAVHQVSDPAEVQWVITVPAIWSQRSRRKMEAAAFAAGIPNRPQQVTIALEPECASITVAQTQQFSVGSKWMLVDCGGGTVDIACHTIDENRYIHDLHFATGGPWGSTFIDEQWIPFLREIFGERVYAAILKLVEEDEPGLLEELKRDFGVAKESLSSTAKSHYVPIPGLKNILKTVYGSKRGVNEHLAKVNYRGATGIEYTRNNLDISLAVWLQLFEIVIEPIVRHIGSLLQKPTVRTISTICVVGGFAESPILIDRIRSEFPDRRVYAPPNPILAVVSGAAVFGLNPNLVRERRAAMTVGVQVRSRFLPSDPPDKLIETEKGAKIDVFRCFVRQNDPLFVDMEPITHSFGSEDDYGCDIPIYQMDVADPPRFVPEQLRPCAKISLTYPQAFDHEKDHIFVSFDFSGQLIRASARYNDNPAKEVEINWL